MERTPGFEFGLVLPLLAVLPHCARGTPCAWGRGDSHSLRYDFNISFNEPRCKVQGQIDGEKFLSNECGSNKVIPMNFLRDEGKATDSCKIMPTTLNDVGDNIKGLLPDIKQEKYPDGDAPVTVPAPATTTPIIASASPAKITDLLETGAIIVIVSVIVLIIICIIGYHYRKRWQKMLKCCWECGLVQKVSQLFGCLSNSSCSPVDLQEPQSLQQMQRLAEGREDTADAMLMPFSP
uniref:Retinoic acid early transcript 1G n=1 Tax=Myotis myotis TaxID=51298 RepID=A0A7J7WWZ6_MYOMY|nr:retinoic acid early transcript 1G [Myotis myotis]